MFRVHIFLSSDFGGELVDLGDLQLDAKFFQLDALRGRRLYDPSQWFWISLASEAQQRAQGVIDEALLTFNGGKADMYTWFGNDAHNKQNKISKVLNTMSKVVK